MHLPTRIRIIIMLFAMLLVGVMFIAATCTYCRSDGVCVTVYSDGHACVYVRIGDGADMMCGGGSSNGGGGGPAATPTAVPTPTPDWTQVFQEEIGLYESGDASCAHDGDPISLVIRQASPQPDFLDLALPVDVQGDTFEDNTRFDDGVSCAENQSDQTSNDVLEPYDPTGFFGGCPLTYGCLQPRWHARVHENSAADPQFAGLRVFATPPHHDLVTANCGEYNIAVPIGGKHYVPADGYTSARARMVDAALASGHYGVVDIQNWGNVIPRLKCGPDGVNIEAASDGLVWMLGLCVEHNWLFC
jgi:hypothetical protein